MAFENYTLKQFEDAWFKGDRDVMTQSVFDEVYSEYIDTAELWQSEEFDKVSYIHFLNNRINTVRLSVTLQKKFIDEFEVPYKPGFELLKKNGHYLKWNDSVEDFVKQLDKVENREKKYISELENEIKNLVTLRKNKNGGKEKTPKEQRQSHLRTVNSLGKIGFKIDKDKITVEEYALMIKQQSEEAERYNKSKK